MSRGVTLTRPPFMVEANISAWRRTVSSPYVYVCDVWKSVETAGSKAIIKWMAMWKISGEHQRVRVLRTVHVGTRKRPIVAKLISIRCPLSKQKPVRK